MNVKPKSTAEVLKHNGQSRQQSGSVDASLHTSSEELVNRNQAYKKRVRNIDGALKNSDENLAVVSKLIAAKDRTDEDLELENILQNNKAVFEQIYKKISCRKENSKNILEMFPDIKLGIDIILSSILSPTRMTDTELNYRVEGELLEGQEASKSSILDMLSKYINAEYKLSEKLPEILFEALAVTGADPHLVLNEAVLDEVVNSDLVAHMGLESFKASVDELNYITSAPTGLINIPAKTTISLEELKANPTLDNMVKHLTNNDLITISDNTTVLSKGETVSKIRRGINRNITRSRGIGLENNKEKLKYLHTFRTPTIDTENNHEVRTIPTSKNTHRKPIGKAIVMRVPTEAVAVGCAPGDKDNHLHYFIMVDENGRFVSSNIDENSFERMQASIQSNAIKSGPITEVYREMIQNGDGKECVDIRQLYSMFELVTEAQILEAVDESTYGEYIELPNRDAIMQILFFRALTNQKTQLLYVPAENLTYFSIMNGEDGLGKTLLDSLTIIASIRANLLFAKLMAYNKSAIKQTNVTIQLDEDDPDPIKTIETIKASYFEANKNYLQIGELNPTNITANINRTGTKFDITGHPGVPDMGITYDRGGMDHSFPGEEFDEFMQKQSIFGIGLRPEIIDDAYSPEFAIQHVTGNSLLVKQFRIYQRSASPEITKYVRSIIINDYNLRAKIQEELVGSMKKIEEGLSHEEKSWKNSVDEEEFFEYYIDKFADSLVVELPPIPDAKLSIKKEELEDYTAQIDELIETQFDSYMFDANIVGEAAEHLETIKAVLKATIIRQWATDNNYMPEFFKLLSEDPEKIKETVNTVIGSLHGTTALITSLRSNTKDIRIAVRKDAAILAKEEEDAIAKEEDDNTDGDDIGGF